MDHLTNDQKRQFLTNEFSTISEGHETLDRDKAALLLEKLAFNSNDTQVSDLLNDADMISNGHIDLNDILRIIDTLLTERNETAAVVYDEPDEAQLLKNLKMFLKRVKQLGAENVVVTDDMFKQLQQEYNVPDHLLE